VLWRFDPIVISDASESDETVRRFERLARMIEGATTRCTISFMQHSSEGAAQPRAGGGGARSGSGSRRSTRRAIAARLAAVAAPRIALLSCCDDALIQAETVTGGGQGPRAWTRR
jgi:hypothetical protein